jgi:hypothetical protein
MIVFFFVVVIIMLVMPRESQESTKVKSIPTRCEISTDSGNTIHALTNSTIYVWVAHPCRRLSYSYYLSFCLHHDGSGSYDKQGKERHQ